MCSGYNWKYTPFVKYYMNRVSLSKDYIPQKCCSAVFSVTSKVIWLESFKRASLHYHRSRNCKTVGILKKTQTFWVRGYISSSMFDFCPLNLKLFFTSKFDRSQLCSPLAYCNEY